MARPGGGVRTTPKLSNPNEQGQFWEPASNGPQTNADIVLNANSIVERGIQSETYGTRSTTRQKTRAADDEMDPIRRALEEIDIGLARAKQSAPQHDPNEEDEELRIYGQAREEASNLIRDHQHGYLPPKPMGPYRYRSKSGEDRLAHARPSTQSPTTLNLAGSGFTPSSQSSPGPQHAGDSRRKPLSFCLAGRADSTWPSASQPNHSTASQRAGRVPETSPVQALPPFRIESWQYGKSEDTTNENSPRTSFTHLSSKGAYEPIDQVTSATPFRPVPGRGEKGTPRGTAGDRMVTRDGKMASIPHSAAFSTTEIHRNPPSRSRNPLYTTNEPSSSATHTDDGIQRKHGMEIRADYIRQATSMRLGDRSSKLPTPTLVSDNPGRPIVSFDSRSQDPMVPEPRQEHGFFAGDGMRSPSLTGRESGVFVSISEQMCATPIASTPSPSTPHIVVEETPSVRNDNNSPVPSISVDGPIESPILSVACDPPDSTGRSSRARPLPTPSGPGLPRTQRSDRALPTPGTTRRNPAACHECGLAIRGRFVALAGAPERFHPTCFRCVVCGTNLEALEIHPEPEPSRLSRLDRISRRSAGETLEEEPGKTMGEDGDDRLRFYCHLDWHELFAPRCKHCKTPILGEHIVALGAHWHQGHFFCAECGDPFENGMTHIEKDGYAWCVKCQTKMTERRAPKCRKCKLAVIGQYIVALGGEWHDDCFRCASCRGSFDDGQIFPREGPNGSTEVLCTHCRAIELKK